MDTLIRRVPAVTSAPAYAFTSSRIAVRDRIGSKRRNFRYVTLQGFRVCTYTPLSGDHALFHSARGPRCCEYCCNVLPKKKKEKQKPKTDGRGKEMAASSVKHLVRAGDPHRVVCVVCARLTHSRIRPRRDDSVSVPNSGWPVRGCPVRERERPLFSRQTPFSALAAVSAD